MQSANFTSPTVQCRPGLSPLWTFNCSGCIASGTLGASARYTTLHTPYSTLHTRHSTQHTTHCTPHTARCTLHGAVSGECSVCRVCSLGVGQADPRGSAARLSQPEAAPLPLSQSAPRKPCLPRVRSAVPQDRDQRRCMQPCGRGQIPQWRDQPSPGAVSVLCNEQYS